MEIRCCAYGTEVRVGQQILQDRELQGLLGGEPYRPPFYNRG
jgi:hypothetical protein